MESKILPNEILNLIKIQQALKDDESQCEEAGPLQTYRHCIVKLIDVYEDEEYVHLVMENCKGLSLNQTIKRDDEDISNGDSNSEDSNASDD